MINTRLFLVVSAMIVVLSTWALVGFPQIPPLWHSLPDEIRVFPGQEVQLDVGPLFSLTNITPEEVELRLLGWLPMQRADVRIVDEVRVIPGGHAVGILLSSRGLVVVRTTSILTTAGQRTSPAAEAGIMPGDVLLRAGDIDINHPLELESVATEFGRRNQPMPVTLMRREKLIHVDVKPVEVADPVGGGRRFMVGVFLKDPAAGVGTLTFWHPETGLYGALGHVVAEGDQAATVNDGRIVSALIHGVHPGVRGRPGEKVGIFENDASLGTIEKNTSYGIYGRLFDDLSVATEAVPIALSHEIREGPAEMWTVLDGNRIERFEVKITGVNPKAESTGRGLVIEVTDPRLLERTNGIVQGMSGSPLLQDNKLIGAVTHVFINNPHRGFGILAEWMLYEAGILTSPAQTVREAG